MSQGRSTPCIGDDGKPPTFNDGNPYNGYITPTIGLIFPFPYYMEMSWELKPTRSQCDVDVILRVESPKKKLHWTHIKLRSGRFTLGDTVDGSFEIR